METFFTILIVILVVSLSGAIAQIMPFQIPLPLIQIITGALLAWPIFGLHVDFNPSLFFVLFIPPLLFVDCWKTSVSEFLYHYREILSLSLVLVFITIGGIGYLIYWIVPNITLIPAFALAAIISPTDAVALSGILGEGRVPKKIMFILQGEALMNDASGLVAFNVALSVAMGGMAFSWGYASMEFLKVSIGGLLVGIILCWIYGKILHILSRWTSNDPFINTMLLLLLPFASYIIAEKFNMSGILSVVATGMTVTRSNIISQAPLTVRLRANNIWQMLEFLFSNTLFLMLGLQLPNIIKSSINESNLHHDINIWTLCIDVIIIYFAIMLVRFIWLWIMQQSKFFLKKRPLEFSNYSFKELLIASFSGVRGTMTLAGILSVPLFMKNGQIFPARHELVFIATGIILLSLAVSITLLPKFLLGTNNVDILKYREEIEKARIIMANVAIESLYKMKYRLENEQDKNIDPELLEEISSRVIGTLRRRAEVKNNIENDLLVENLERRLRLTALRAERAEIYHLRATKQIADETMNKLLNDLDLLEILLIDKEI